MVLVEVAERRWVSVPACAAAVACFLPDRRFNIYTTGQSNCRRTPEAVTSRDNGEEPLSATGVAKLTGGEPQDIASATATGAYVAALVDREYRYPTWQFRADGTVSGELVGIYRYFGEDRRWPWISFLRTPLRHRQQAADQVAQRRRRAQRCGSPRHEESWTDRSFFETLPGSCPSAPIPSAYFGRRVERCRTIKSLRRSCT